MIGRLINLYYKFYYRFFLNSRISVGDAVFIHNHATFIVGDSMSASINIDTAVYIGRYANIHTNSRVSIGKYSVISDYVYISTMSHGLSPENGPIMAQPVFDKGDIVLGQNVFLGFGVKVLPNVTLGDWCIVGAGSVVTKSFPSYVMIAGNPARIIRKYDFDLKQWVHCE